MNNTIMMYMYMYTCTCMYAKQSSVFRESDQLKKTKQRVVWKTNANNIKGNMFNKI